MRLFVAVELDEAVRAAAAATGRELEQRVNDVLRARWVPAAHMHLTVRFIGEVAADRVPDVLDTLRSPVTVAPFDIELNGCGRFPSRGAPRVLWIGLSRGLPSLAALHDELNRRLAPLGFDPEGRPFSAHLTLARVKQSHRDAARSVREAMAALPVPAVRCRISAATVFESSLSPKGSTYTRLLSVPLTQPPNPAHSG